LNKKIMPAKGIFRILLILFVVIVNIGCDQVSKKIVRHTIAPYQTIVLLNNHLTVTNIENPGAFLSLGDSLSQSTKNIFLLLLPIIVLTLGLVYILAKQTIPSQTLIGLCFIIGGGIGNIFDRVVHGSVTDFFHIQLGVLHTGIFNMADVSIVAGVLIIIIHRFFIMKRKI
jgi:signal peptidase II